MYYWIYQDDRKKWRWTLYTANNSRIAESTGVYEKKQDCEAAIERVKASTNAVVKQGPLLGRVG
jgi:uncharacterized protein YegP (UPF0339 family)